VDKFHHEDGYGSLFINKPKKGKELHPKAPQRRGTLVWHGEEIQLSGWIKRTKDGEQFLSLKAEEPRRDGEREEETPF
jgi:hypothetical protein